VRLTFWRKQKDAGRAAPPSPYDRWLSWARIAALVAAFALFALTVVPLAGDFSARNEGGDINVTVEFYTAFERGGGFITWDFSPGSARILRERIDGNADGIVDDSELYVHTQRMDAQLTSEVLVIRNFEMGGIRVEGQRGLSGELVNSSAPAYLQFKMAGQWAERDADIPLFGDSLAAIGYGGNVSQGERIHERTLIIDGGLATFTSSSGHARVLRVPAGVLVVATRDYTSASSPGSFAPDVHFARFSAVDSSLVLLAPLALAYFIGVAGARRERQATRQPRVEPFHQALNAGFLLLLASYFAAVPGILFWIAGVVFGVGALMLAYRVYPADRRPEDWQEPTPQAARPKTDDWAPVDGSPEEPSARPAAMVDVGAMLDKAHGPLDPGGTPQPAPSAPPSGMEDARQLLPKAVTPLDLPDDDTPRPDGRVVPARPSPPGRVALQQAQAPAAAPAGSAATRVRCPGCKHYFEARGARPLSVTCPHCGRRGVLR